MLNQKHPLNDILLANNGVLKFMNFVHHVTTSII